MFGGQSIVKEDNLKCRRCNFHFSSHPYPPPLFSLSNSPFSLPLFAICFLLPPLSLITCLSYLVFHFTSLVVFFSLVSFLFSNEKKTKWDIFISRKLQMHPKLDVPTTTPKLNAATAQTNLWRHQTCETKFLTRRQCQQNWKCIDADAKVWTLEY